jgi:hypothetical protein
VAVLPETKMPSFRYRNVHSHWKPSTWIWTSGVAVAWTFISVCSPNGNRIATMRAGIAKKMASDRLPPTECAGGASSSTRLRYRTTHQISSASTPMNTGSAKIMMTVYS